jgi:ribosomal protein L29
MLVAEAKDLKDKIDELNKVLAPERQIQITSQGLDFDNPLLDAAKIEEAVMPNPEVTGGLTQNIVPKSLTTENPILKGVTPDFPRGDKGTGADPEEKEDIFDRDPSQGRRIATRPDGQFTKASMRMKGSTNLSNMIKDVLKKFDREDLTATEGSFADGGDVDTPKRGFVDEPGSYGGKEKPFLMKDPELVKKMKETKKRLFREKPVGKRLQWIADNGKNYNNPEKFIKAYEKHFKHKLGSEKDVLFNKEGKNKVALGSIDGLQNTGKIGAEGGDLFMYKKGFSEAEIFKASIIQNNPKVQKQFKNLFKNIADNVSEYQELGPQGIVKKLNKDGGNLLNDFDFLESYNSSPDAKQTYGGVHAGS